MNSVVRIPTRKVKLAGVPRCAIATWVVFLATAGPYSAGGQSFETSFHIAAAPAPAAAGVSPHSNKKIRMVTETLKDILQSIVNEEKQDTDVYNKYMSWCKDEISELDKDLQETRSQLANAKVLYQQQVSTMDDLKLYITKSEGEIDETKDAMAQAAALRNAENEQFVDEMQINTQGLRQLDLAIKHVDKVKQQGGFLQNGVVKKLQVNQPGESSYVLGVLKGLKEKLSKSRAFMRETEGEKLQMHNTFMGTKSVSLKAMEDKKVEKKIKNSEIDAKQAGQRRKITRLNEEVTKLLQATQKTNETCESTRHEWVQRHSDRTKEKAALHEAIRYLYETALEQLSLAQKKSEAQDDASVVFAPDFLQEVTDSNMADNAFFKAAGAELLGEDDDAEERLKKNTFNGVKTVVKNLIASHMEAQKEETARREYCTKEIDNKYDEEVTIHDDLEAVQADIDQKIAEVEMLSDEVKSLYDEMDATRRSVKDAGKVRKEQNAMFVAGSKDRALAIKVLQQAKSVLQEFYDQAQGNLLQQKAAAEPAPAGGPPPRWASISPRKSTASFGAVSMIQDITDDIAKEQKDATMQENNAAAAFAKLQEDSQEALDEKQQDITERVTEKAKLGVQINTLKETHLQKSNDLDSVQKQLAALHSSCDEILEFHEKRAESRNFEVNQLKDVLDILSGSAIAARTGLLEKEDDEDAGDMQEDDQAELAAGS